MLDALHFIRPWWLVACVPALLLVVLWARRRIAGSGWDLAVAPELLQVLLEPGTGRRARYLPWLVALWLLGAGIGLAGPSWERLPQPVEQRSDALVILLDLSLSMYAEDVAPSRLVRARQKVADILRTRDEGFTALIAYAGDAHAVVPLTDDVRTIENLLGALSPDMMPVLGSNLGRALEAAHELFRNARVGRGRILVLADAVEQLSDVSSHRDVRYPVSLLGIGTLDGATIPLDFVNQPGQIMRSQQGDAIVARLDETRLEEAAQIGHGRYHRVTLSDRDIDYLLSTRVPGDADTLETRRQFDLWADMGFWLCVPLLVMLLLGFRRGVLVLAPLLLLPQLLWPPTAEAGLWEDLWRRGDQQGYQLLRDGDPERAIARFEDPEWQAAALYRSGDYPQAASAYGAVAADPEAADVTSRYNLGNALARQQDYHGAIAQYREVLDIDPDHEDARFNKELVERILEQQPPGDPDNDPRQQEGDDPPEEPGDSQNDDPTGTPSDEPAPDDPPPPEQAPPDPDPEAAEDDDTPEQEPLPEPDNLADRDERQEALEQWLRQVPDDPGGLLRRKFQHETNQRMRRGEFRSRDSDQIW